MSLLEVRNSAVVDVGVEHCSVCGEALSGISVGNC